MRLAEERTKRRTERDVVYEEKNGRCHSSSGCFVVLRNTRAKSQDSVLSYPGSEIFHSSPVLRSKQVGPASRDLIALNDTRSNVRWSGTEEGEGGGTTRQYIARQRNGHTALCTSFAFK
ncbi:hypothetical protein PS2_037370 [Malus domestica]